MFFHTEVKILCVASIKLIHVSLVAVDAEKVTTTSRRPPHKKSRQETQSIAALFKPSIPSSGGNNSGQWRGHGGFGDLNPHLPPGQLLGFVQNRKEIFLEGTASAFLKS
jgi:hypothetical protein